MNSTKDIRSGLLPWTRSCFVCGESNPHGLHLRSRVEGGRVLLDYTTREADLGYRHIVHGGIAATLLDEVMTWAAILAIRQPCVAAEFTIRLRKPIQVGERLRVEGEVSGTKSRLIFTQATIANAGREVVASAAGKYVAMPAEDAHLCSKDFVPSSETLDPAQLFGGHEA